MKYISRYVFSQRHKSWYVRVPTTPRKAFTDGVYGGMQKAMRAAIEYRDRMMKRPSYRRYVRKTRLTPGRVIWRWITVRGWDYLHAQAHLGVGGKLYTKTYSARMHGREKAWKLAEKALKEMRKELL